VHPSTSVQVRNLKTRASFRCLLRLKNRRKSFVSVVNDDQRSSACHSRARACLACPSRDVTGVWRHRCRCARTGSGCVQAGVVGIPVAGQGERRGRGATSEEADDEHITHTRGSYLCAPPRYCVHVATTPVRHLRPCRGSCARCA
jgi:hypothetical protein